MKYTICEKVMQKIANGDRKAHLLVLYFTYPNNHYQVVYNDKILEQYKKINHYDVSQIIEYLTKENKWSVINIENHQNTNIFLETCKETYDKQLIVNEKEDFSPTDLQEINVKDISEAFISICTPSQTTNNFNGNVSNATTGHYSPINNGEHQ